MSNRGQHRLEPHAVYYLRDPHSKDIRWVGSTYDPIQRARDHDRCSTTNAILLRWLIEIRPYPVDLQVVCWVQNWQEAIRIETRLCIKLRAGGVKLLNVRDGTSFTKEERTRRVGVDLGEDHRRASSDAWTPARRAAQSELTRQRNEERYKGTTPEQRSREARANKDYNKIAAAISATRLANSAESKLLDEKIRQLLQVKEQNKLQS